MCDFSVVAKNQRDYRAGEELVITQLGPHTKGTTSPSDLTTAVCLRSGACLLIPELPQRIRQDYELPDGGVSAIFMQLPNREYAHRDALVFSNGRTSLMNELPIGLRLVVSQDRPGVTRQTVGATAQTVPVRFRR